MADVQQRPQPAREVIDVDTFFEDDDDEIVVTGYGYSQPIQSTQNGAGSAAGPSNVSDSILVLDSDDEHDHRPHRSRHRLISPPPRHVHPPLAIPPVPPLPRNLGGFPGYYRHQPPAIVPNPQPFAFEAQLNQQSRRTPDLPSRGSARSHHQPVMGLGGAIITAHRINAADERSRRQMEIQRNSRTFASPNIVSGPGFMTTLLNRVVGARHQRHDPVHPRNAFNSLDFFHRFTHPYDMDIPENLDPALLEEVFGDHIFEPPKASSEIMYRSAYTHPSKPQPGFTFDFAPSDSEPHTASTSGSSTPRTVIVLDDDDDEGAGTGIRSAAAVSTQVETKTMLVCAHCLDPLVLSTGTEAATEQERRKMRVWALRCGHMFDGKCIHALMRPAAEEVVEDNGKHGPGIDEDILMVMSTGNWKGKTRATEPGMIVDRKGKRKDLQQAEDEIESVDNSIRSRLRPRHPRSEHQPIAPSAPLPTMAEFAPTRPTRPLPLPRRHPTSAYTRAKGKGKARKPEVLQEYVWHCPVAGCRQVHRSVKISGDEGGEDGWTMDKEKGAVALFV